MKIAVCPGSFDPITLGHLDIIERASELFDKVIVLVMSNSAKRCAFTVNERIELIKKCIKSNNIEVDTYSGLLIDYAKQKNVHISVRGLRAISDFEYELQTAQTNRMLSKGGLDTLFLTTSLEYAYLSSSSVKEIAAFNGDISQCVPDFVADLVYEKMKLRRN